MFDCWSLLILLVIHKPKLLSRLQLDLSRCVFSNPVMDRALAFLFVNARKYALSMRILPVFSCCLTAVRFYYVSFLIVFKNLIIFNEITDFSLSWLRCRRNQVSHILPFPVRILCYEYNSFPSCVDNVAVIYVCMYVCVHVFVYVCTYVCMYVCVYLCVCFYVCMHVCVYECMYMCIYLCMYVLVISDYVQP
jgi:hypothetical protein